jgi:hypothetical protein
LTRAILALALRAVAKALRRPKSLPVILSNSRFGGEGEIRTHEGREALPVFKTGAFNRSATSPCANPRVAGRFYPTINPLAQAQEPLNGGCRPIYRPHSG